MNRHSQIIRTSWIGIGANVLLAAFKAVVGLVAGSVAIVMDAVNNLSDALSVTVHMDFLSIPEKVRTFAN